MEICRLVLLCLILILIFSQANAQHESNVDTFRTDKNKDSLSKLFDTLRVYSSEYFEKEWNSLNMFLSTNKSKDSSTSNKTKNNFLNTYLKKDSALKNQFRNLVSDSVEVNLSSLLDSQKNKSRDKYQEVIKSKNDIIQLQDKKGLAQKIKSFIPLDFNENESHVTFSPGYINYNYLYRSAIDTPFVESGVGQHMITAGLDVSLYDLPFRLSYFGRQSNSLFLRDYHDFRIDFNAPEFRRINQDRLKKYLHSSLNDFKPEVQNEIRDKLVKLQAYRSILEKQEWINLYIQSKRILSYRNEIPTEFNNPEGVIAEAESFVKLYESKLAIQDSISKTADSLQTLYQTNIKKIQDLQGIVTRNMHTSKGVQLINEEAEKMGMVDKSLAKRLNSMYAVRAFSIGRTLPRMTPLTVNNISVNGLNFEYNSNNYILGITAGKIDFRSRDFLYGKPSPIKQYVYAASIGYGLKEGNNVILTGYSGRKQIISSAGSGALHISGMSIQAQWIVSNNVRILGEIAQSNSPVYTSDNLTKSQGFKFNDKSNKAYSVNVYGYLPSSQTKFEGSFQKTGINFQNFTNYRINADNNAWSIKADQFLWKKQIRVNAAVRKNEFSNPFVIQQYNSNTIFTTLSVTVRLKRLPVLTVGYLPSSQYTMVDRQVVENRFQTLNIQTSHSYKIGIMRGTGNIIYNRFYNSGSDRTFIYYNANHFYTSHQFAFALFTSNVGFARTQNKSYSLSIMEGGLSITRFKKVIVGFGLKINNYNTDEVKTGSYFNIRCNWKKIGDFNFWYERGYLPSTTNQLVKNEWLSIGFVRYFNNTIKL